MTRTPVHPGWLLVAMGIVGGLLMAGDVVAAPRSTMVLQGGGLAAHCDEQGVEFVPLRQGVEGWSFRYRFTGVGRKDDVRPVSSAEAVMDLDRVTYRRGGVVEAYRVAGNGIEQTFLIEQPPAGAGAIVL